MTTVERSPKHIAILGAGITGLTAALRLTERGHVVRVFEAMHQIGGAIRTEISDGWLVESGPNSLLDDDSWMAKLIDDLGLENERVPANPAARKRFIVRHGRPIAVPLSPPAFLFSRLFSARAKMRILLELFARPRTRNSDVTIAEFIRGHFGNEVVTYGLNPFAAGTYAGNPRKLSARFAFPRIWDAEKNHGSLLRSQMAAAKANAGKPPGIFSFRRGLQTLPNAILARLPASTVVFNARVETLLSGPTWNVVWSNGQTTQTHNFDRVIVTLPAPALAQLRFGSLGERPLASLDAIEHPPVSSLFLGFHRDQVSHPLDGFGVLVPEVEKRLVLGILFSSSLFPGRAPDNHVAVTVLVGGTRSPELARLTSDELIGALDPELRELLGVRGRPVFHRHTFWPSSIPQYNVGYDLNFETIEEVERRNFGVYFGGQARDGISVPCCIAGGERVARAIQ